MPFCLLAPSHYLNHCWLNAIWTHGNKSQWDLNQTAVIAIQENAFEIIVCKMTTILFMSECMEGDKNIKYTSAMLWIHLSRQVLLCLVGMREFIWKVLTANLPNTPRRQCLDFPSNREIPVTGVIVCYHSSSNCVSGEDGSMIEHCQSSWDSGNIGYLSEMHLKLECC